jgi:hypothetical protein
VVWVEEKSGIDYVFGARVDTSGVLLDSCGVAISGGGSQIYHPAVGFDGTNYLVAWQRYYGESDIYGARVSPGGVVLDPAGIAIAATGYGEWQPAMAFDGTNYLVVYYRGNSSGWFDVYGVRVSPGGVILDPAGIVISAAANDEWHADVAFDGTNYLVVWEDNRTASWDIYGARVTVAGAVLDPTGIAISTTQYQESYPAITSNGTGWFAVWEDYRINTGVSDIYGARVNGSGVVLDPAGVCVSAAAGNQLQPAVAFDDTNYLVVWQDYRIGAQANVYGARVSEDGIVLDPTGIGISLAVKDQTNPAIASGGAKTFVAWQDYRNSTTDAADIYGARVSVGGSPLDPDGIAISKEVNNQLVTAVAFDGTNYLVVWEDYRNSLKGEIYGTRVSADGEVLDPQGIVISTGANGRFNPAVAFDGTNYLVVWQDYRYDNYGDIFGARVGTDGVVLNPGGIIIAFASKEQLYPALAFDGTNYLVVWQDKRSGSWDIYGARVSVSGTVLDPIGLILVPATGDQGLPAIAFEGTNYLMVWHDARSGSRDIYGSRVSVSGSVLDGSGFIISAAANHQDNPAVAFDGTDYLVAWQDMRNGPNYDIYGARVTVVGAVLDTAGMAISTAASDQYSPAIAYNSAGYYLVAWQDNRNGPYSDMYGARVAPSGTVLDPTGLPISTETGYQRYAAAVSGPESIVLLVYSSDTPELCDAYHIWGNFLYDESIDVERQMAPVAYVVHQSYPNPFNPVCTIRYEIPVAGFVSLRVFDVTGSLVRTLVDGWRGIGVYNEVWDGRGEDGKALPSGVYFYSIKAGKFGATRKIVLLK